MAAYRVRKDTMKIHRRRLSRLHVGYKFIRATISPRATKLKVGPKVDILLNYGDLNRNADFA